MKRVLILGSTGSIGTQALEIAKENRDKFEIVGLVAASNSAIINEQAEEFSVKRENVILAKTDGQKAVIDLIEKTECDVILNGITGSIGLEATLKSVDMFKKNGTKLALANKESLVSGGALVKKSLEEIGVISMTENAIIPVDSEHSAIWQCLRNEKRSDIAKIILTASGGPFRSHSAKELEDVSVEQALNHPNWSMGKVVTINSATMMNKALEVIEAAWLFGVDPKDIQVLIHPQSIVHSGVQFKDGALVFEASNPDMKLPISLGMNCAERLKSEQVEEMDYGSAFSLDFAPVNSTLFPAIDLAVSAFSASLLHPTAMNAANEIAVEKFLRGEIKFTQIIETVEKVLEKFDATKFCENSKSADTISFEIIEEVEKFARSEA